jgi:hypothetical protein
MPSSTYTAYFRQCVLMSAGSGPRRRRSSPRMLCAYWPEFSSSPSLRRRCCLTFPSLCLALRRRLLVARRRRSTVVLPRGCGERPGPELAVAGGRGGVTQQSVILVPFSSCVSQVEGAILLGSTAVCLPAWPRRRGLTLMVCAVDLEGTAERMAVWRRWCGGCLQACLWCRLFARSQGSFAGGSVCRGVKERLEKRQMHK